LRSSPRNARRGTRHQRYSIFKFRRKPFGLLDRPAELSAFIVL
jgi:hypothetical protein